MSRRCIIPSCGKEILNEKYEGRICWSCYRRKRLYGSFEERPKLSNEERFWSKVDRRGDDECWPWTDSTDAYGYGHFRLNAQGMVKAHRMAWIFGVGEIPEGIKVRHGCDNPPCCNYRRHLLLGTQAENIADMDQRGRRVPPRGERHAKAKLTDELVRTIRDLQGVGLTRRELGVMFGVSPITIRDVAKRRTWIHI